MTESKEAVLRIANLSDGQRVTLLLKSLGLKIATEPEAVRRRWEGLWKNNPALAMDRPSPPLGWVLEADEEIVGFFGSIPIRYRFGDRELLVGVGTAWAVLKPFRRQTGELSGAYFDQTEVDLLMGTTGIPASGRIYLSNSGSALPHPDWDRVPHWVLDETAFMRAALRKGKVPSGVASVGAAVLSPFLSAAVAVGRRRPGRLHAGIEPESIAIENVGDEFDDLWRRKLAEGHRLYAGRASEDIRWHFEPRDGARAVTMLCGRRDGRLEGYLVWERKENYLISGLTGARIVDMLVASNDERVIDALVAAAYESAREQGCHVLEMKGFPREIRSQVEGSRVFSKKLTPNSFCFRAQSSELHSALQHEDTWYPTLYDGDGSLD
ncbi:MAG: hypothetical protein OES69_13985 [Myxococcales bacterium]|nr:hypothetical protein [Myxococcales bacterium]MDH3845047.1 hypothetical protein [Myxococcales bacterium]